MRCCWSRAGWRWGFGANSARASRGLTDGLALDLDVNGTTGGGALGAVLHGGRAAARFFIGSAAGRGPYRPVPPTTHFVRLFPARPGDLQLPISPKRCDFGLEIGRSR